MSASDKDSFLERGQNIALCPHLVLRFINASYFPKILPSLKLFSNSWNNLHTKFVIKDTKIRFACGELILY